MDEHTHTWRRYALYDTRGDVYAEPIILPGTRMLYLGGGMPPPPNTFYVGHNCACGEEGYRA
jgi:hypothetical protein